MQAHSLEVFSLAKIVFYPKKFYYPLLLPSHNCINNFNVQFSRCIFESPRDSMKHLTLKMFQSISLSGGEYRDRTGDLLLARQALSQLS